MNAPGIGISPQQAPRQPVRLEAIRKSYGSKIAVDIDAMTVAGGEFLTLLGPSGCGKTTLLMTLAGFVRPDTGTVHVGPTEITRLAPEKRNFGMVFQGYALFPHLTVWENIAFPLRRRGLPKAEIVTRVEAVLEKVQLSTFARRQPRQLSGGQQQRVALARAIVFEPDLVLLDEPLSALDTALRQDLQVELKTLHREIGMTFICVTHDQEEALSLSDRVAVMRDGRVIQLAEPSELYNAPKTRFVAGFMGARNLISVEVVEIREGMAVCRSGEQTFQQRHKGPAYPAGSRAWLALRPQRLGLGPGTNQIQGTVASTNYLGADTVLTIATPVGPLTVSEQTPPARHRIGSEVLVAWEPEDAVLVADD